MKIVIISKEENVKEISNKFMNFPKADISVLPFGSNPISFIAEKSPSCILIDEDMANPDPLELANEIKSIRDNHIISLFVLTSGKEPETEIDCLRYGVDAILNKSLEQEEFINEFEIQLDFKSSIRATEWVGDWIEFVVDNEVKYVKEINNFMDRILVRSQIPDEECFKLTYAFREMVQNAWEHGNQGEMQRKIKIAYVLFEDRVLIKIEDEGTGFLIDEVEDPTSDPVGAMNRRKDAGKRIGGWGIVSVKKVMDDVMYNEKGNTVLMIKYLKFDDKK